MNVADLIKLLEPYKDLKVSKNYTVETNGDTFPSVESSNIIRFLGITYLV